MLHSSGARLAVPLLIATTIILVGLHITRAGQAQAIDGCRPTPTGIVCGYSGSRASSSSSSSSSSGRSASSGRSSAPQPLPPLRYLRTQNDRCWYWSRYRPGFDSWNSAYDQSIILTRWRLPECGRSAAPPPAPVVTVDVVARAWSVFRAFPLDPPIFRMSPTIGITNLPSRLHLASPRTFTHAETLPDGRRLEVQASVSSVLVEWSDGTPGTSQPVAAAIGDPGAVRHTFFLKSCPPEYRSNHLDGSKCHPILEEYPITVTLRWTARYRANTAWTSLGTIDRPATIRYDVDEVLGVLGRADDVAP